MQHPRIFGWGHIRRGRTNIAPPNATTQQSPSCWSPVSCTLHYLSKVSLSYHSCIWDYFAEFSMGRSYLSGPPQVNSGLSPNLKVLWRQAARHKSGSFLVINPPTRVSSKFARCSNWHSASLKPCSCVVQVNISTHLLQCFICKAGH